MLLNEANIESDGETLWISALTGIIQVDSDTGKVLKKERFDGASNIYKGDGCLYCISGRNPLVLIIDYLENKLTTVHTSEIPMWGCVVEDKFYFGTRSSEKIWILYSDLSVRVHSFTNDFRDYGKHEISKLYTEDAERYHYARENTLLRLSCLKKIVNVGDETAKKDYANIGGQIHKFIKEKVAQ